MKEELKKLGFVHDSRTGWMYLRRSGFEISCNLDGYFFLYTDESADKGGAVYKYKGVEKLSAIIKANEEYFK